MTGAFQLSPERASTLAPHVDHLFWYVLGISAFFTVLIAALIAYFAIRYRRRSPNERPLDTGDHMGLEITWIVIPLIIALSMFAWGAAVYVRMSRPPADAMEIHVVGKQWMWKIQHPTGRREINELHVPLGRPIKLVMTSQDVIHSFFIPAFRIKQDVLPGRYTTEWFQADKLGEYHLFCSQYCGAQHAGMVGRVVVMTPADYQAWLAGGGVHESPVDTGKRLFDVYGCNTCHGQVAPTLAGLYGSRVLLSNGSSVVADDAYLRESIVDPSAKLVAGYPPIMPSFRGQLTEEQIFALLSYIKSLKQAQEPPAQQPQQQQRPQQSAEPRSRQESP